MIIVSATENEKLKAVLILFRIGIRAPQFDDFYKEDYPNCEIGCLSKIGF